MDYAWMLNPPRSEEYDPLLELRNAIILRAVNDYRIGRDIPGVTAFFRSSYFRFLCAMDNTSLNGETLIAYLKKEREDTMKRRKRIYERRISTANAETD